MSDIGGPVDDGGIGASGDPLLLFASWMDEAKKSEPNDPTAAALATVDGKSRPNVRMVLLKDWDADGFVFYSNRESTKGAEIASHPHAALCLHWKSLRREIRIRGSVTEVSAAEADAYFASRAKDSQIGAWASAQSRPMQSRFHFEKEIAKSRQTGVANDNEELELGVRCMAAGIYDDQGKLIAGLSISAPADRLDESWLPKLQDTARNISMELGNPTPV